MQAAIEYEIKRQIEALERREKLTQETRGWNEAKKETYLQRSKEEAHDYRYFPEPDLPAVISDRGKVKSLEQELPELPASKKKRFEEEYGLSKAQSAVLVGSIELANFFEETAKIGGSKGIRGIQIANHMINKKLNISRMTPVQVIDEISGKNVGVIVDVGELEKLVKEAIEENPKVVEDYKKGKETAIQALIGAVMRKTAGKANAGKVRELLIKILK